MNSSVAIIKEIPLDGTKKGLIAVSKVDAPYGEGSDSVASIGISLSGDAKSPEWKVHIPLGNIDDVIAALQLIK
ncbi:MAG TPA: hypothetical protein PLM93_01995 [Sulfuricurvum sp.]|nr:MAG: hypothetical protein B7Y30_07120 [Campylobacterales bacterium 16-40-21]OZA03546.1 MAG: hypothetical protein B7X89_02460 [Sulfuricurvum sp. 17-40-25]HQS65942.1 hypothetical protein [Sulfuricurvum sp.]HQT35819.1 hypothetical protein [Sulfuricurvum sp.]